MTDKLTAVEHLEALLHAKDLELAETLGKLAAFEEWEDFGWMRHRLIPTGDDAPGLPVPRLQIRIVPKHPSWYVYGVHYELVYQHYLGIGGVKGDLDLMAIPLGYTKINGGPGPNNGPPIWEGKIDLPRRDGVHIVSDAKQLGLPMFALCDGKVQAIEPWDLPFKRPEPGTGMAANWKQDVREAIVGLNRLLSDSDGDKFNGYVTPETKAARVRAVEELLKRARTPAP